MTTDFSRLTESPGDMNVRSDGARYHDGESIVTHLNYALEPWGWDWAEIDNGMDVEADEVWVLGQLTARFVVESPEGGERVLTTTKTERGWQKINRLKSGSAKSIGDDKKGAATDALKRCARLLGVGLDAWAKGGVIQQRQRPEAPKPLKTKLELVADVQRGVEAARGLGLDVADIDAAALNRAELIETVTGLADMIRRAQTIAQGAAS